MRSCSSRALKRSGVLTQDPVFVDEHLDAVIVHRDPRLLSVLREQCLAPLDTVAAASRQMLLDTLRSWLRDMGDLRTIADELHVHRQTVRYRLGRLRELFGGELNDPDRRAQLILVLAWDPSGDGTPANAGDQPGPRRHL